VDGELTLTKVIPWDVAELSSAPPALRAQTSGSLLRGTATHLGEDGVLTLRLSDGNIQLEMQGQAPADILEQNVAVVLPV
jgi:hypothetical protein